MGSAYPNEYYSRQLFPNRQGDGFARPLAGARKISFSPQAGGWGNPVSPFFLQARVGHGSTYNGAMNIDLNLAGADGR